MQCLVIWAFKDHVFLPTQKMGSPKKWIKLNLSILIIWVWIYLNLYFQPKSKCVLNDLERLKHILNMFWKGRPILIPTPPPGM